MAIPFENLWEIDEMDVAFSLTDYLSSIITEQMPQFAEMFPFNKQWEAKVHTGNGWFGIIIKSLNSNGIPIIGQINDQNVIESFERIFDKDPYPNFITLHKTLGTEYFDFNKFTYVGKFTDSKLSWIHMQMVLVDWLNQSVLPVIYERNRIRVLSAIPSPPTYDTGKILSNTYILESEKALNQGTCFHLKGVGLITCEHVIQEESKIFDCKNFTKHFSIQIEKSNDSLDLAVIKAEGLTLNEGLEIGSADNLQLMDHIAAIGFPNYRFGDSGIFSPGLVIGFRTVSGVRRILTNIPLIAGNSGGPVIDRTGKVIGIVVTGADRMEDAHKTENHGIIPIETIGLLN